MSINSFNHRILDGIVDPEDQPVLEKYVVGYGVSSSYVRDDIGRKQGRVHTVTLDDGSRVRALWRGQRDLEGHTEKNLIKQTTSKGNVRYYMLLDSAEPLSLTKLVDNYIAYVVTNPTQHVKAEGYKFEAMKHWWSTFDIEAPDIAQNLKDALSKTSNLTGGGQYYPVATLLKVATADPDAVRNILRNLFDESQPEEDRISSFFSSIWPLVEQHGDIRNDAMRKGSIDARFVSLLLSFRFPNQYMNYKNMQLLKLCKSMYGSDFSFGGDDTSKVLKAKKIGLEMINEFNKHPAHAEVVKILGGDDSRVTSDNLWFAQDIYWWFASEQETDILELVRRFVNNVDELKNTTKEFSVKYHGLESKAVVGTSESRYLAMPWFTFAYSIKDLIDNEWRGGWVEFKYNRESDKLYLVYKWTDNDGNETDSMRESLDPRMNEIDAAIDHTVRVKAIYDPHDIPDAMVDDFNELVEEYKKEMSMQPEATTIHESAIALNTILYGPPGTGKTWNAINTYAKQLLELQADQELSAEEVLSDSLIGLTWWQVAALALSTSQQPLKVVEISNHMTVKAYSRYVRDRTTNIKPTLWAVLQERSDAGSSNTAYKVDGQEYFTKDDNSRWSLTSEGRDMVAELLSDIPTTAESQQGTNWTKFYRTVTFHQSYSYEEFIEGIRPNLDSTGGDISYEIKPGIFKELSTIAANDPDNKYLLIIDEINRGNIAKIFGELITLLEDDKRETMKVRLPYSQETFTVPKNLYVLGTMNTADRSIALLDIALRRRFEFVELMPKYDILSKDVAGSGLDLSKLLEQLNQKISIMIDRDHQIGHSYFMKVHSLDGLHQAWYKKIVPLVQEYFYNDWERLEIMLGKHTASGTGFVASKVVNFPGEADMDDTTLYDIHQYTVSELVKALKDLIVDEQTSDTNAV